MSVLDELKRRKVIRMAGSSGSGDRRVAQFPVVEVGHGDPMARASGDAMSRYFGHWERCSAARTRRSSHRRVGFAFAWVALLAGCAAPPPPATVVDLAYPVLVLFEDSGTVRHDSAEDLTMMRVQRVIGSNSPPYLIDSHLDIYRLDALGSTHNGLWLMANPNGLTEVHFKLERIAQADGKRARQLLVERDAAFRGPQNSALQIRLNDAKTLQAMLAVIEK